MTLFAQTTAADPDVFYKRGDANDVRLGESVHTEPDDYAAADIVVLGLPQDEGVRRNQGRVGAKDAPDAIRRSLYKYVTIAGLRLFDAGNTIIQATLEVTHDTHHELVRQILRDGKHLVVLGGGNDCSYPDCAALVMETVGDVLAFNIDAHFDVRADAVRNSGTPYRQLLEEGHISPQNFYEIAYQPFANALTYIDYLAQRGVQAFDLMTVHEIGLDALLHRALSQSRAQAIFWGLDMDVVRAADAPGVSALNPSGLTGEEFCRIGRIAGQEKRTRIFEISEVNPHYDIDDRTCRLAAAAIWHFLAAQANVDWEGST
jgi:formiminoglutamase